MSAPYDTPSPAPTVPIREVQNRSDRVDAGTDPLLAVLEAAHTGDTGALRRSLDALHDLDALGPDGFAALHLAASAGRARAAAVLLTHGAGVDVRSHHPGGYTGATPLLCAVAGGHAEVARRLLSAGADPDARDDAGLTPLHVAAAAGAVDVVKALLLADAALEPAVGDVTPLDLARRGCHLQVMGLLLQLGAR